MQILAEARNSTAQTRRSAVILGFAAAAGLAAAAAAAVYGLRPEPVDAIGTTSSRRRCGWDASWFERSRDGLPSRRPECGRERPYGARKPRDRKRANAA